MGIVCVENWWISCDHDNCFITTDEGWPEPCEDEDRAVNDALTEGFEHINGRWYCPSHAMLHLKTSDKP